MDVLSRANWVDLLVVIICLRTIYISFQDGLSREIFPLFGSILSLVLALHLYTKIGSAVHTAVGIIPLSILNLAGFITMILAAGIVLKLLRVVVDAVIKVTWHPLIEKFGGVIVGVLKGAVVSSTVLVMLALVPLSYLQASIKDKSLSGMFFLRLGPGIYRAVSGGVIDDDRITKEILSGKNIPVKKNEAKAIPEWEKAMVLVQEKPGGKG